MAETTEKKAPAKKAPAKKATAEAVVEAPALLRVPGLLARHRDAAGRRIRSAGKRSLAVSITRPGRVLAAAVVLAIGATVPRALPVPGSELDGVMQAMDFLPPANRVAVGEEVEGQVTAEGKDVVIIGGGDTGADCIGTSIRQGAKSVTSLEIMPQPGTERPGSQPWPTYPMLFRVASAHEEGGDRVYAVSTTEIIGDDEGKVSGLRLTEVERTDQGFEPVEGTERVLPAQLVLLAMGFLGPDPEGVVAQLGLETDERSNIVRGKDYQTGVPGVFVAGDAGRGQSLIVWAIAEGRAAANGVDTYLMGRSQLPRPINPTDRPLVV